MIDKIIIENVKGYGVPGKDLNVNLDPTNSSGAIKIQPLRLND